MELLSEQLKELKEEIAQYGTANLDDPMIIKIIETIDAIIVKLNTL
jgi:hypothetical protein|tara:strand:+ start:255 stop:392 length:138 start_codon:yes stop_codon:yes gene_type:complete